jgi:ATP-dependent helicase/nuclease subunit B
VSPPLDPQTADVLARGGRVVTATMRAARALRRAYADDARRSGLLSWPAPRISDWSGWTAALYDSLSIETAQPLPEPISALQEELLWRRVQREDAARVVSPARLAKLAGEAYALLNRYDAQQSRKAPWAGDAGEDTERFLQWCIAFERECARLQVTSRSSLEALLRKDAATLSAAQLIEPELLLVGFDRLTPSQSGLLAAFGTRWAQARPASAATQVQLSYAPDERSEIDACARWVRAELAQHTGIRIGVLAPQLSGSLATIERSFRKTLLPDSGAADPPSQAVYEFSLGDPLAAVPNIAAALLLLAWTARPLAGAEVSSLLTGGFFADDPTEAAALAQADVELRRRGRLRTELSLQTLLQDAADLPQLLPRSAHARLQKAQAWALREAAGTRTYAEWCAQVPVLLTQLGWPGIVERGSVLFQAEQRWNTLADETAHLGFAGDRVRWRDYLGELRGAASSALFAAESSDAPVQVIGISEASGQSFDAIWVLGMTEENWPLRGRPHPLLPAWLQREHGMPHASPQADLALAEEQLRRVQSSAPRIVWSCALLSAGTEQQPSPMLAMVAAGAELVAAPAREPAAPPQTVRVADSPQGSPWPVERIAGGSEVLKHQAACGFQSFAQHRLRAAPLEPESWGLNAADRGKLLHRALESLWSTTPVGPGSRQMHTLQDLLNAMGEETLVDTVHVAVTEALAPLLRGRSGRERDDWMAGFLSLEKERLCTRIHFWLDEERRRAPFRVIALEKPVDDARIGELRLRLRLDRADAVAGRRALLIDYKSADGVSVKQWEGTRPDEPQLPVYALYGALYGAPPQRVNTDAGSDETIEAVGGIAFAQIRAGEGCTRLHALAEDPEAQLGERFRTPEGKPPRHVLSSEMRAAWDAALQSLAAAFVAGEAPVNPKHGAATCRNCNRFVLCRIRSQDGTNAIAEEDDSDA